MDLGQQGLAPRASAAQHHDCGLPLLCELICKCMRLATYAACCVLRAACVLYGVRVACCVLRVACGLYMSSVTLEVAHICID